MGEILKRVFLTLYSIISIPSIAWAQDKTDPLVFGSYPLFRDHFTNEIREAKKRVIIATKHFTDGDLATAAFSAKVRNLDAKIFFDKKTFNEYLSRYFYFQENNVLTYLCSFQRLKIQTSIIGIDSNFWLVNAPLDFKWRGSVTATPTFISEKDLENWIHRGKIEPNKPLRSIPAQKEVSANIPTSPRSNHAPSDTIKWNRQHLRLFTRKGLPAQTRLRLLERGILEIEPPNLNGYGNYLSREPEISPRESDLP